MNAQPEFSLGRLTYQVMPRQLDDTSEYWNLEAALAELDDLRDRIFFHWAEHLPPSDLRKLHDYAQAQMTRKDFEISCRAAMANIAQGKAEFKTTFPEYADAKPSSTFDDGRSSEMDNQ